MEQQSTQNKIDAIVVGAGPAGVSAAITIARNGKKVVLVERAPFAGAKNMYGGVIYTHAAKELFPNYKEAPIERFVTTHSYVLLSENDSTEIKYKNPNSYNESFVAIRAKWDNWCVEQAIEEGVYFAPNTLVKELLIDNGKVIGIKTDVEEYYANIVIIADGVNSLLAKQIGLRKNFKSKNMVLGVKEVIKLTPELIEQRFGLTKDKGCAMELVGGPLENIFAMGIVYTNKDSIAIGLGASLEDLKNKKIKPYELLDKFKQHPFIQELIENGELVEYSAHLIPEGGYNNLPKLYTDGALVVGDAAGLVNNVHFEGTNLAMLSGKFAGETAIEAINKNDFSENQLSLYQKKLSNSFILKDLKTYKDTVSTLSTRTGSFLNYYPKKVNEFFEIFTTADGIEKKGKFQKFTKDFFMQRNLFELFKDGIAAIKIIFGILK